MSTPPWWPKALAATRRRREYTAELLAHATPTIHDGVLRLEFTDPAMAAAWRDSGAQAALEGALHASGQTMPIQVVGS